MEAAPLRKFTRMGNSSRIRHRSHGNKRGKNFPELSMRLVWMAQCIKGTQKPFHSWTGRDPKASEGSRGHRRPNLVQLWLASVDTRASLRQV
jgi:hypothetical protein